MTQLLGEVQAAAMLGYVDMADFRRAVRAGLVPAPSVELGPRRPRWRASELVKLVDKDKASPDSMWETLLGMDDAAA